MSVQTTWVPVLLPLLNIRSNTGVSGTLPNVYAALQQLQEFSALNCSELSGQLPPAWGLLNLEVLEITNSKLSGELPREWTDAAALRQAAAAAASSTLLDLGQWNGASPQSKVAGAAVVQSLPQPAARAGLAKLRVLDLSVSGSSTGKISGSQLDNFSGFEQLQRHTPSRLDAPAAAACPGFLAQQSHW
ncbi:hypothetical protein OEZ85_011299 [Tetradesmus obliquus]|uniref:Uncharacterized protein n=1 Tax=Tetradesmus obliquus TaxID=3088 RepID=A0ABY8TS85_TETOB|nr:hypothetical protein OEZ85_011299 [Tetradesmus obliquus]